MAKAQDTNPLKVNRLKLDDELADQAAVFNAAALDAERLHGICDKLALQIEIFEDEFTNRLREKYRNVNPKLRPTETAMKAILGSQADYQALRQKHRKYTHAYRLAKVLVESHKMRAEMMVSIAHNSRAERKSSDRTRA